MTTLRLATEAAAAAALAAVVYHYLGYPLVLWTVRWFVRRPAPPASPGPPPSLSVVVPCYNEGASLAGKLDDLAVADYPAEKVEVVVVSDGSDDDTVGVASGRPRVRLLSWEGRRGKPAALNAGAAAATGEILVFTDANARLPAGSLRALVAPFADPRVGAVAGEQVITRGAASERTYWRWESRLKSLEAAVGSIVGADGSLYAVRRELYRPVPESRLLMDDFYVSLEVVAAGYRLAYAPAAVAYEEALTEAGREFRRKARIMDGSLAALSALSPAIWRRLPVQLFSHKILRWLGPWILLAALAAATAAAGLGSAFGLALCAAQGAFYVAAAAGWAFGGRRAPFILRAPYFFVLANAALAWGWLQYAFGGRGPAWEKLR